MNSWWTVGRVIWVTICSTIVISVVGNEVNSLIASSRAETSRRLREAEETKRRQAEADAKIAQAKADEARWRAEEAATKAACDDCANFVSRDEVAAEEVA